MSHMCVHARLHTWARANTHKQTNKHTHTHTHTHTCTNPHWAIIHNHVFWRHDVTHEHLSYITKGLHKIFPQSLTG